MLRTATTSLLIAGLAVAVLAPPAAAAKPPTAQPPGKATGKPSTTQPVDAAATPAYALPSWSDGQWGSSEAWDTIQTGDLDGDGTVELIGRSSNGVEAWDFDIDTGQWAPLVDAGQLGWTDAGGWDLKEYYETIGTADFDGDGKDELYARDAAGVVAYSLDTSADPATWSPLVRLDAFSEGWSQPGEYDTIQAADLDGDGADELFGRNSEGLVIAQYENDIWFTSGLSEFTDAQGWDHPEYYRTIQAADIDGDGADEVFARASNGITVWGLVEENWQNQAAGGPFSQSEWSDASSYETIGSADLDGDGVIEIYGRATNGIESYGFSDADETDGTGTFTALPLLSAFTDAEHGNHADRYVTIQAADVDGDGRAEVVGRQSDGMQVWGLNPSSKKWAAEQKVAGPAFTDALGWTDASHYGTIQTADVDGFTPIGSPGSANAGRAELIGRGSSGIQTYRFDAKSGSWVSPSATFPQFTGKALKAYQIMSAALVEGSTDIRSQYDSGYQTLQTWATDLNDMIPIAGIPTRTWDAVQDQIYHELLWAYQVAVAGTNHSDLITAISNLETDDQTAKYLDYRTTSRSSIAADLIDLLAGLVDAASNLGAPELQVAMGAVDAIASFTSSASGGTKSGTYEELFGSTSTDRIAVWWTEAQTGVEQVQSQIMADYGLLSTVGDLYERSVWKQFPKTDTGWAAAVNSAHQAYSTWVWQTLTPTLDHPCDADRCDGWGVTSCTGDHCDYTLGDDHKYTLAMMGCEQGGGEIFCGGTKEIAHDLRKQLFDPTANTASHDCLTAWDPAACDYGVDPIDVFLGRDGWTTPCGPNLYAGSPTDRSFCDRLTGQAALYGSR